MKKTGRGGDAEEDTETRGHGDAEKLIHLTLEEQKILASAYHMMCMKACEIMARGSTAWSDEEFTTWNECVQRMTPIVLEHVL